MPQYPTVHSKTKEIPQDPVNDEYKGICQIRQGENEEGAECECEKEWFIHLRLDSGLALLGTI